MGMNASSQPGLTIAGMQCNAMEQLQYHIHAHLDIFVNGQLIYAFVARDDIQHT